MAGQIIPTNAFFCAELYGLLIVVKDPVINEQYEVA